MRDEPLRDLAIHKRARALWAEGRHDDALRLFEAAAREHADNVWAQLHAAHAYAERHDFGNAERLLDHARTLITQSPQAAAMIARTYQVILRPDKAIDAFRSIRALGLDEAPDVLVDLARLYERTDRTEDAREILGACLYRYPDSAGASLLLARLERRTGNMAEASRLLGSLANRKNLPPRIRAEVFNEVARVRDAQGDYDGAWQAIESSKTILRTVPEAERLSRLSLANSEVLRRLYAGLDAETLLRWRASPPPDDTRVSGLGHLLGFPRSGTTLLEQVLDAHPGLVSSQERAVFSRHIFPALYRHHGNTQLTLRSLDTVPGSHLRILRSRYLDYLGEELGEPLGGRFHLDKNPNHTSLMLGLYRLFPESRFLVALRDPRDVLVSCYLQWLPLSEFSAAFLTPGQTCLIYAFEMSVWQRMKTLLPDGWLEIHYEDVVDDLPAQARKAVQFLGLPWDDGVLRYRALLKARRIDSPTHEDVRRPLYTRAVGRWRNYEKHLGRYFERLAPYVKALGY